MKVIEPERTTNLVRADSLKARNGFRYFDKNEETYMYFVPMKDNSHHLYIRRTVREGQSIFITPVYILVFSVRYNTAGIVKADRMVEPINFVVNTVLVE